MKKPFYQSRKCFYGTISMYLCFVLYVCNIILVTWYPHLSGAYLSLFNTMISYVAGITAGLCGLHTFMDYSTTNTNSTSITK